jgi:hypothetical protein
VVEEAQVVVHEGDEPDSIAHLLDSHVLTGEGLAQVDLALAEADAPAVGDRDRAVVERIVELA